MKATPKGPDPEFGQAFSRVAIVGGTGRLGLGLARRLYAGGINIVLGSRDPARAETVARSAGLPAGTGQGNADAAAQADVIIVTVPHGAHSQILLGIAKAVATKVVVDTTVPFPGSTSDKSPPSASAAEEAQALLPAARVVAGFHTVSAVMLTNFSAPLHGDVLLCGDDGGAKEVAAGLAHRIGMRSVDVGPLAQARLLEQLAGLLVLLNRRYKKRDLGIQIAGLTDDTRMAHR